MIEVRDLTMTYPNGKGIFDLNFEVRKGEVFGFLGPNGAGKTTTIRNLMGFVNWNKGSCTINGLDCRQQASEIQAILGYLSGEIAFFDEMTGSEFFKFMAGMRRQADISYRNKLIDMFELESDRQIRKMSKGMKQKVGLITAFMHDPSVLLLDEPTSGLDPLMQKRFVELIIEEKKRGKTIFMSSHSFEEIERTCDRAGIIREGRLVAVEEVAQLKSAQRRSYIVTVATPQDVKLIQSSGIEVGDIDGTQIQIFVSDSYDEMLQVLSQCKVTNLEVATQSLEEVFMHYYSTKREGM